MSSIKHSNTRHTTTNLKKCVFFFFFFLTGKSRFWKRFCQPFLDLKNSKAGTHVCNLLNLSDLKKLPIKHTKTRNTINKLHATLDSQLPTFLVITRRPWQPLAAPGSPWQLLAAPGSYKANFFWDSCPRRAFLAALGSSWQLLAAPGSSWQPLAAPGSYKAHILNDFCPWRA